jgi:membrane protease subunit (stomatin/prohibitin family)
VLSGVKPHVDGYGLTVVRMGNFTVSIKDEDEATLKKLTKDTAYSKLAGGFQQYAQGQAMLGASEGMAKGSDGGGAALQGAGLGLGFAMAGNMAQQARGPGSGGAPQAAAGTFCPNCGTPGSGKFCGNCGQPMAASRKCASCGTDISPGAKFCGSCGKAT